MNHSFLSVKFQHRLRKTQKVSKMERQNKNIPKHIAPIRNSFATTDNDHHAHCGQHRSSSHWIRSLNRSKLFIESLSEFQCLSSSSSSSSPSTPPSSSFSLPFPSNRLNRLLLISVLIFCIIHKNQQIECYDVTPYRNGLARYYQGSTGPGANPSNPYFNTNNNNNNVNTYQSYSISLPVQTRFYGPFLQSYYQAPKYQPAPVVQYIPGPQFCPETGRTVCSKLSTNYPTDEVYMVIKMAKAKRFNISSEFMDESDNDSEPYFEDDFGEDYDLGPFPFPEPYPTTTNGNNNGDGPENGNGMISNQPEYHYHHQTEHQQPLHQGGDYGHQANPGTSLRPPPPPQQQQQQQQQQMQQQPRHPSLVQHYHNLDWKFYRMSSPFPATTITAGTSSSTNQNLSFSSTTASVNITSSDDSANVSHLNNGDESDGGGNMNRKYGSIKTAFPSSMIGGGATSSPSSPINHYNSQNKNPNRGKSRFKRQTSNNDDVFIEPLCPIRTILLEPKAALNDRRQWKFVVNVAERDPRLRQAIKVEVCLTPNSPCSNQISLPFGFISRCKQKYIKKKLISLDESGQSISSENFFAPSCCVCEVTRAPPTRPSSTNSLAAASSISPSHSMPSSRAPPKSPSTANHRVEKTKRRKNTTPIMTTANSNAVTTTPRPGSSTMFMEGKTKAMEHHDHHTSTTNQPNSAKTDSRKIRHNDPRDGPPSTMAAVKE